MNITIILIFLTEILCFNWYECKGKFCILWSYCNGKPGNISEVYISNDKELMNIFIITINVSSCILCILEEENLSASYQFN